MRALTVAFAALALTAPSAHAGKPITKLAACADQDMQYQSSADAKRYRAAVFCLINAVRKTQGFGPLKRDARLEKAGQGWATAQRRVAGISHGKSVAEIPKRIARAGYRASALNEGLGLGEPSATPYDLAANMMDDYACTEILDPRFRDAGVGVSQGPVMHVVVEFGLKRGSKAPSQNTKPSKTCPHSLPAP